LAEISEDIAVPQMINLDALTKIILAFQKAGADQKAVPIDEIAQISGISASNISINNRFFLSIGLLEGTRGSYKLTTAGSQYAKALDWGRLEEAQSILKKTIKDKPLVQKTVNFVDLNKPVSKDDLSAKIAGFAGVPNEQRFSVGIRAFVEMLTLSKILEETKDGLLVTGPKEEQKETKSDFITYIEPKKSDTPKEYLDNLIIDYFKGVNFDTKRYFVPPTQEKKSLMFSVTINVDNNTDPEKLKQIIKALQEAIQPST
jgi:hypothetical protein